MSKCSFYFASAESPTQFNLQKQLLAAGFESAKKTEKADFSDNNLTLNEDFTEILEYKHLLAALTEKHCPDIMPLTFLIDDNNYNEVIDTMAAAPTLQPNFVWILKPALLNNAEGIKIFNSLDDIKQHFEGTDRFGGQHVLQQYITHPHLLNGHKYTFRMFVIISNFTGVYLYKNGYFNVAREAYPSNDFSHLEPHLTNEHLHADHSPNVWQIPTKQCPNFDAIYQKMQHSIHEVIAALNKEAPALFSDHTRAKAFSFFGFDFMLDEKLKLWLLEVNHAPCFPKEEDHLLQEHLYDEFWKTIITSFIVPMTEKKDADIGKSQLLDEIQY